MEQERGSLVSPSVEVPVVEGELVTAIRRLADCGWGTKAIARELAVARNTVRRYVRAPVPVGVQVRPTARRLSETAVAAAQTLFGGEAAGNAVVVQRLLAAQGSRRACGRCSARCAPVRAGPARGGRRDGARGDGARRADADRLRREARPDRRRGGHRLPPRGRAQLLTSAVRQSVSQRAQDDWREGIAAAFCTSAACRGRCSATMRAPW